MKWHLEHSQNLENGCHKNVILGTKKGPARIQRFNHENQNKVAFGSNNVRTMSVKATRIGPIKAVIGQAIYWRHCQTNHWES